MKLSDVSEITLGTNISRLEPASETDEVIFLPMVTMQDITYHSGYKMDLQPAHSTARISASKKELCLFARPGDLLYGFTQFRSVVVGDVLKGRLVPSNLALIRINTAALDPFYLMWALNEGPCSKEKIYPQIQGMGPVKLIKPADLRDLEIRTPPPMEKQKRIGGLYRLLLKRKIIGKAIEDKESTLLLAAMRKIERED